MRLSRRVDRRESMDPRQDPYRPTLSLLTLTVRSLVGELNRRESTNAKFSVETRLRSCYSLMQPTERAVIFLRLRLRRARVFSFFACYRRAMSAIGGMKVIAEHWRVSWYRSCDGQTCLPDSQGQLLAAALDWCCLAYRSSSLASV